MKRLLPVLMGFALLFMPVLAVSAEEPKKEVLELKDSEVSFIGDDSFITERYVKEPFPRGYLWIEWLKIRGGGIMTYEELAPRFVFREASAPKRTIPSIWNSEAPSSKTEIKIQSSDVESGGNDYGTFYYVVKSGGNASCGLAVQIWGKNDAGDIRTGFIGKNRFTIRICRYHGKIDIEDFFQKIFKQVRYDEGAINDIKAASGNKSPKISNSQPMTSKANSKSARDSIGTKDSIETRLERLKKLLEMGLIKEDDAARKRKEILDNL